MRSIERKCCGFLRTRNCDEFPKFYFSDGDGNFAYEYPCWNDDWERELRDSGSKTVAEWNQAGRMVQKGVKGVYLPCARTPVFRLSKTTEGPALRGDSGSNFEI